MEDEKREMGKGDNSTGGVGRWEGAHPAILLPISKAPSGPKLQETLTFLRRL